jgi:hypothetical protein
MTAVQLQAELLRELSVIVEDESLVEKVLKYVKKLTAKKPDPTLMPKEEFLAKLERGEEEFRQGKTYSMLPGESYVEFRKRIGR